MADIPVIDVHMHTHQTSRNGVQAMGGEPRVPGYTGIIDELLPLMEREYITHVGMQNFTPVWDMTQAAYRRMQPNLSAAEKALHEEEIRQEMVTRIERRNDWSCEVAREHPNLLAFIGIDPVMDEETLYNEVIRCSKMGGSGIKLHTAVQRLAINDRRLWPAYQAAEETGTVILAHSGPFFGAGEGARPNEAREVFADFPGTNMILAHCGGQPHFEEAVEVARDIPQLNFDCCGLVSGSPRPEDVDDETLVKLFRDLGTDRVLFGTDWPFRDPIPDVQRVLNMPLTDAEKEGILSKNALRVLGV